MLYDEKYGYIRGIYIAVEKVTLVAAVDARCVCDKQEIKEQAQISDLGLLLCSSIAMLDSTSVTVNAISSYMKVFLVL